MSTSSYLKSFFEKGKIIIDDKKVFNLVLNQLHTEHEKFVQECTRENILRIDHQNLIIELIL